jgi:hypothetical protein
MIQLNMIKCYGNSCDVQAPWPQEHRNIAWNIDAMAAHTNTVTASISIQRKGIGSKSTTRDETRAIEDIDLIANDRVD